CYNILSYKRFNQTVSNCIRFFLAFPASSPARSNLLQKLIMKTYFCIMIALCMVLVIVQAAEMGSRARRQSDNVITLNIPRDLLDSLLKALLGEGGLGDLLKNILGNGGGN
ncbi:uncharacterized protein TNCT_722741, partial [Trichonephila clavata]